MAELASIPHAEIFGREVVAVAASFLGLFGAAVSVVHASYSSAATPSSLIARVRGITMVSSAAPITAASETSTATSMAASVSSSASASESASKGHLRVAWSYSVGVDHLSSKLN